MSATPLGTYNETGMPWESSPKDSATRLQGTRRARWITPDDSKDIQIQVGNNLTTQCCRALTVFDGTKITVCFADDDPDIALVGTGGLGGPITIPVTPGMTIEGHIRRVWAGTNTDATKILAHF